MKDARDPSNPYTMPMSFVTYTEIRGLPPIVLAFLAGTWISVGLILALWLARHL